MTTLWQQICTVQEKLESRQMELESEERRIPKALTHYVKYDESGCATAASITERSGYVAEHITLEQAERQHTRELKRIQRSIVLLSTKLQALEQQDQKENPLRYLPDLSRFKLADVTIHNPERTLWRAYWEGRLIGAVVLNTFPEPEQQSHERSIFKSFVEELFRLRGVATLLYDAAESYANQYGWKFVPSPRRVRSNDALALWCKRDPEAVKNDGRHWNSQYVGRSFMYDNKMWCLTSVLGEFPDISFMAADPDGAHRYFSGPVLFPLLGNPKPQKQPTVEGFPAYRMATISRAGDRPTELNA